MSWYQKFIQQPVYAILIMLLLFLGGMLAYQRMPLDLFPGLNYPLVNIITQYPGVSPEDMEILITRPIENEMQNIRGVRRTSSISTMGISQVTVEFTRGYDIIAARQFASAAISRVASRLPAGVHPEIDNLGSRLQQIVGYTFCNPGQPLTRLRQIIQYRLVPSLHSIPGISRIDVLGGRRAAYVVEPDINKMNQLHISLTQLEELLRENNLNISGRYLQKYSMDIPIRGIGQIQTLEDVRNLRVATSPEGLPIFLKDIARIRNHALPEHYLVNSNGKPAVAILIQKENGYNTIELAHRIDRRLQSLRNLLPPNTRVHKFYDQSEILTEAMGGIGNEIVIGAIFAILVLFFFLRRWLPTFIVAITIPLSLLAAFVMMYLSGFNLNMMTLAALTLSIGMVVDDSVIVMENIERLQEEGAPLYQAVHNGTFQILGADVSGTLTTIIVFLPLLFLTGFLGQLITPFGLTIAYTLLTSLFLSLTIIPSLMHWKGELKPGQRHESRYLLRFLQWNRRWFLRAMNHKRKTFAALLVIFTVLLVALLLLNPLNFLPPVDEGTILVEYIMRPGVSLKESTRVGHQLTALALQCPDVDNVYLKIGSPENTYYIEDVNHGELLIKLKDKHHRQKNIDELMREFREQFSTMEGMVFLFHLPTQEKIDESFSGLPAFFGISLSGDNLDTLVALSEQVEKLLNHTEGLSNVINNAKFTVPQIEVIPRRAALAYHHLTVQQLMEQVEIAFRGRIISYFVKEQVPVALFLRLPEEQRQSLEDLKQLPIHTPEGTTIPLQEVSIVRFRDILPTITHLNTEREITLIAEPEGNIWAIVRHLKEKLSQLTFPAGYTYRIRGQYQVLLESLQEFAWVIISAILLIYLILYLQFRSFWQPFVILFKVPLDFIGAFLALLLTRQTLNVSVAIGLLTLVGVAVNNAIVLIDLTDRLIQEKKLPVRQALEETVRVRTRPVLMTGMTTIFALLPAAIGSGIGSKIHQPFAITLIGGMLTGIFFSLNVIPALYEGIGNLLGNFSPRLRRGSE